MARLVQSHARSQGEESKHIFQLMERLDGSLGVRRDFSSTRCRREKMEEYDSCCQRRI